MFCFSSNLPARDLSDDNQSQRSLRGLAAAFALPLTLAACGETEPVAGYAPDNAEATAVAGPANPGSTGQSADNLQAAAVDSSLNGTMANTASQTLDQAGTDQVGTSSATGTASKLTDTAPASAGTSVPTEKVDSGSSNASNSTSPAPAASAPATSAPAAEQAPASTAVNSVQTVVDDMALLNDAPLVGVNPDYGFAKGPGFNVMGNNASGDALPAWYLDEFPAMANTGAWNAVLPWFVMFEGEGNRAVNARVQMRELKVFVLSRATNRWQQVMVEQDVDGEFCPAGDETSSCSANQGKRTEASGGVSVQPQVGQTFHGWFGERTTIDGADVAAVFVTMQSRLTGSDTDLNAAKYLIDVGADYYPDLTTDLAYVPGVGVSRAKLLTGEWQSFNFMTFSDVGNQEPGGGISQQQFTANPPPMD